MEEPFVYERRKELTVVPWNIYREEFLRLTKKGDRVLDVGVGNGSDSAYFLNQGRTVVSVDLSVNQLKTTILKSINNAKVQMDLSRLAFADNSFDAIWLANVIIFAKNAKDRVTIAKRCASILRPGGIMFLCDNFFPSSRELEALMSNEDVHFSSRVRKVFDRDFEVLKEEVGVDIPEKRIFTFEGGSFHTIFLKVKKR